MKGFWRTVLAVILGIFLYSILMWVIWVIFLINISLVSKMKKSGVEANSVLVIKLNKPIVDKVTVKPALLSSFMEDKQPLGLTQITKAIEYASTDPRIKGILLDTRFIAADWAQIEEISEALKDFKNTNDKFIVAYSDMYTHRNYYLSSVADSIYMTPNGTFMWTGLSSQVFFYKKLLDKLGIQATLIRHGKYKSAAEPFIREDLSEPNREQLQLLLDRVWGEVTDGIAANSRLSKATLDSLADNLSIRTSHDAVKYGLVDGEIYYDQLLDKLKSWLGLPSSQKLHTVSLSKYYEIVNKPELGGKNQIAVVFAQGNIVDQGTGMGNEEIVGKKMTSLLRKLRENPKVKAVVLRVNSPGGSALASEEIWREVVKTKEVKPVIVSMGGVAASGGYYISCAADQIVADKMTITGSIGVFGLFLNAQKLMNDKFGITYSVIKTNKNSDINPFLEQLNPEQYEYIKAQIDNVYDVFLQRVADGRGMSVAQVDSIAQGRVWSAIDAKQIGLVDTLGGLQLAIELAAKKADLLEYSVVEYPRPKTFLEALLENNMSMASVKLGKNELYDQLKYIESLVNNSGIMALFPYKLSIY